MSISFLKHGQAVNLQTVQSAVDNFERQTALPRSTHKVIAGQQEQKIRNIYQMIQQNICELRGCCASGLGVRDECLGDFLELSALEAKVETLYRRFQQGALQNQKVENRLLFIFHKLRSLLETI